MENQQRPWLGNAFYTAAIFGAYVAQSQVSLSEVWQPARQAA
ncbi:MAG TPA: hypothetical protein VGH51_16165 [Candidatus Angelobacter sp.]|jgi:hypothetical protein